MVLILIKYFCLCVFVFCDSWGMGVGYLLYLLYVFFLSLILVFGLLFVYNNWYFIQYFYWGIFSKEYIMSVQYFIVVRGIVRVICQLIVGYVRKCYEDCKMWEMWCYICYVVLSLNGDWLEQVGFLVGMQVRVLVLFGKLVIENFELVVLGMGFFFGQLCVGGEFGLLQGQLFVVFS